jgi:N-acetyl-anhydromuramyl-L-alanine amidase AmpD
MNSFDKWKQFLKEQNDWDEFRTGPEYDDIGLSFSDKEPKESKWFYKCPHGTCPDVLAELIEQFGYDPRKNNPYMSGGRALERFLADPSQFNYKGTNSPFPKTMYYKKRSSSPKFIVLHITQTSSTSSTIKAFLKSKPGQRISSHYEVSLDGVSLEYLPPEVRAGHSGAGNDLGIGVDITGKIVDKKGSQFGEWVQGGNSRQLNGLERLINKLSKEFAIPKVVAPYNFRQIMWEMKGLQDLKLYASSEEWQEIKSEWLCKKYNYECGDSPDGTMIKAHKEALDNNQISKAKAIEENRKYKIELLKKRRKTAYGKYRVSVQDIISNGIGIVPHHVIATDLRSCPGPLFPYKKYGKIWKIPEEHITFEEWEVKPVDPAPKLEVSPEESDMSTGVEDPILKMSYPADQMYYDEEELLAPKGLPSDAGP